MPVDVIMPNLGMTSDESTFVRWLVEEGQSVAKGQPIFQAESEKATLEVEAPESGKIGRLKAVPGDVIAAGTVIALLFAPDETDSPPPAPVVVGSGISRHDHAHTLPPPTSPPRVRAKIIASPLARRIARQNRVNLASLRGTGPRGRIIAADVRESLAGQPSIPDASLSGLTGLRATIARRMVASAHTAASVTLSREVSAGGIVELRETLQNETGAKASLISYDLLFAMMAARVLVKHPGLNATLTPQGIIQHPVINVGVAVDTERGLLVPVLKNAAARPILELADELQARVARARAGKATPDDLSGGTFTITNLGALGIDAFTPIINFPECAILGIGRIKTTVVEHGGTFVPGKSVWLSLTFDHRLVDGAPAARFLQDLAKLIERPSLLWLA